MGGRGGLLKNFKFKGELVRRLAGKSQEALNQFVTEAKYITSLLYTTESEKHQAMMILILHCVYRNHVIVAKSYISPCIPTNIQNWAQHCHQNYSDIKTSKFINS